jgi:microcystin-dependent protein
MDEIMGTIKLFAGNFAPRGYFQCNGALLPISQYSALFSILGTMYGGDGVQTFALPDFRGRVPVGIGQGPGLTAYAQGEKSGVEANTILTSNMPSHSHGAVLNVSAANADAAVPAAGLSIAVPGSGASRGFVPTLGFNSATPNVALNPASVQVGVAGGSLPLNNIQPFLGMMYLICVEGVYPSRP